MPKILGVHHIQDIERSADPNSGAFIRDPLTPNKIEKSQNRNQ
jgi:hypothetical protein